MHEGKLRALLVKYSDFFVYMIFGAMATAINTFGYAFLYEVLGVPNVISTVLALVVTIIFAFFTNKIFVYRSKGWKISQLWKEASGFLLCRTLTGLFDVAFMFVTVDCLELLPVLMKFIASIFVGIANYLVGKLLIFRKKA